MPGPKATTTRSGNPAKKAAAKKAAASQQAAQHAAEQQREAPPQSRPVQPSDDFAPKTWGAASNEVLEVPSGQLCRVRRPGIEGLMKSGILHNLDTLTELVDEKHIKRVNGKPTTDKDKVAKDILDDPAKMEEAIAVIDSVVCHVVVEPQVLHNLDEGVERDPNVVYAEDVGLEDKLFILNYAVGGTRDLERFHSELQESMGSVDPEQAVEGAAK